MDVSLTVNQLHHITIRRLSNRAKTRISSFTVLKNIYSKMANYGISEKELAIVKQQAARRAELRKEFLMQRSNPFKHASQAGYVFDPAIQRFMSMKVTQYEYFQPNPRTSLFGIAAIIVPMISFGYLVWNERNTREQAIRKGELVYRDRLFKFI